MKPEELRVGNYINDANGKPQQIDEIIRHPFCERMYAHIIKFKGWGFKSGYVEDLKPIPITKQWLNDFGIAKRDSYNWYRILKIETPYDNIYIDLNLDDNLIYINSSKHRECMKPIKYIHQLQNLIFTLKGEELVLNDTALSKLILNKYNMKETKKHYMLIFNITIWHLKPWYKEELLEDKIYKTYGFLFFRLCIG